MRLDCDQVFGRAARQKSTSTHEKWAVRLPVGCQQANLGALRRNSRQPAVHGLAQQVGQGQPGVRASWLGQVLCNELAQSRMLVQLADQNQTSVGSHPRRPLEIHFENCVET